MTTVIPAGWKYAGPDYNGRSNSYLTELEANHESALLRRIFPKRDFTSIPDDNGRWIIITNDGSVNRKKSKSSKPKRKTCYCRKK